MLDDSHTMQSDPRRAVETGLRFFSGNMFGFSVVASCKTHLRVNTISRNALWISSRQTEPHSKYAASQQRQMRGV
jgi:hypothetical protein